MKQHHIGLATAVATAALTVALAPAASASPYHRHCGSAGDGAVLGNSKYEEGGPYGIRMSAGHAREIARRFPPGEFGTREKARDVPCFVAQSVALSAGAAWLHWSGNDGTVRVIGPAYGGDVRLGRFRCIGRQINQTIHLPPMTYHETVAEMCVQGQGRSRTVGTFRIGTYSQS